MRAKITDDQIIEAINLVPFYSREEAIARGRDVLSLALSSKQEADPVAAADLKAELELLQQDWWRARAVDGVKHMDCMGMVRIGDMMLRALVNLIAAKAQPALRDGWTCVPVKPTKDMLKAGEEQDWVGIIEGRAGLSIVPDKTIAAEMIEDPESPAAIYGDAFSNTGIWAAMLAAAPQTADAQEKEAKNHGR